MEYLKESVAYQLENGDPLMNLGAEIDGRLVAYVLAEVRFWEFGHEERTGWINWMGVDPDFQGKGIGRKLSANLFEYFRRKKVKSVQTLVDWYEGQLMSFFRSLNFSMLDTIVLAKELDEE
jgi:GNAT superfamily N-acetyltransferase